MRRVAGGADSRDQPISAKWASQARISQIRRATSASQGSVFHWISSYRSLMPAILTPEHETAPKSTTML